MNFKKIKAILFTSILTFCACGCTSEKSSSDTLSIAYQYGIAYAPIIICQDQNLINKYYEETTGNQVSITWNQMSSGADINTGIASGSLNVGFLGIAPALNGISSNLGYKIFSNISGQPHALMTNDSTINSLGDIISGNKQIALVNTGSIQHIILAKSLYDNGYDPHILDSYIVSMKHPDGMNSLLSGSISCHLTTVPYVNMEKNSSSLHEIIEVSSSWSADNSFVVGVASTQIYEDNPQLYNALCNAIAYSIDFINNNPEEAAKITCNYTGNTFEDELEYILTGNYTVKTSGILELSSFMTKNGFMNNEIATYNDIVFDNVTGD